MGGQRAGPAPWRALVWGLAVATCVAAGLLPTTSIAWAVVVLVSEIVATTILGVAVLRLPGRSRTAWSLFWAYQLLTVLGDVVYTVQQNVLGQSPFPGPADPLYLLAYVALVGGLAVLVRRQQPGRDLEAWIDSAIITGAAVAVVGAFVLVPLLDGSQTPLLDTTVAVAYPVLDLAALSVLVRLLIGHPRRLMSMQLLTAAVLLTMVADFAYNVLVINEIQDDSPGWLEAVFLAAIWLFTTAGTASDAPDVTAPVTTEPSRVPTTRRLGLAAGVLTPPVLLAVVAWESGETRARLLAVTSVVVIGLVLWRTLLLLATVERQAARLAEQARTDPLTRLANRRTWDFQLERIGADPAAGREPLTLAMLDLDHFKAFNDEHGHPAGDAELVRCAQAWSALLRPGWFLARYGGEEFALLLPGLDGPAAFDALDRIRRATPGELTVSIGHAQREPGETLHQTLDRADQALYAAKLAGRDRVIPDPTHAPGSGPDPLAPGVVEGA